LGSVKLIRICNNLTEIKIDNLGKNYTKNNTLGGKHNVQKCYIIRFEDNFPGNLIIPRENNFIEIITSQNHFFSQTVRQNKRMIRSH